MGFLGIRLPFVADMPGGHAPLKNSHKGIDPPRKRLSEKQFASPAFKEPANHHTLPCNRGIFHEPAEMVTSPEGSEV